MRLLLRGIGIGILVLGLAYKSLFGSIEPSLNENATIDAIKNRVWTVDGYFVHYDKGVFDWFYLSAKTKRIYKLEGMDEEGYFVWSDVNTSNCHIIKATDYNTYILIDCPTKVYLK